MNARLCKLVSVSVSNCDSVLMFVYRQEKPVSCKVRRDLINHEDTNSQPMSSIGLGSQCQHWWQGMPEESESLYVSSFPLSTTFHPMFMHELINGSFLLFSGSSAL